MKEEIKKTSEDILADIDFEDDKEENDYGKEGKYKFEVCYNEKENY